MNKQKLTAQASSLWWGILIAFVLVIAAIGIPAWLQAGGVLANWSSAGIIVFYVLTILFAVIVSIFAIAASYNAQSAQSTGDSDSRLQAIFDSAVDAMITIDEMGGVLSFNKAAENMFGYRADEVVGNNVKMLMPASYANEHDGYLSSYRNTGVKKVMGVGRKVAGRRKDGSEFPMHLSLGEAFVDDQRIFVGIGRDMTDVQQANERVTAILSNAVDAIITIDEIGEIQTFNPAAEKLFGYSIDEVVGKNIKMLMPTKYSTHHDEYLANYRNTGIKKIIGIGREVEGMRKDGSVFPCLLSIGEMNIGGERSFVGVARDQTSFKESQDKLKQSEAKTKNILEDLQHRLASYRDLVEQVSNGDLTKRVEVIGEDDLSQLGVHLNEMTGGLGKISLQIKDAAVSLASSFHEVEKSAAAQAASASEQASSVNETTSIIEQIKTTSKQTLEKAQLLGKSAEKTRTESDRGLKSVEQAMHGMRNVREKVDAIAESILALSEQTQTIGEITEAVGNLAQQSKLLALNASIEAAKAGEAGKGFAVVATEVKELAEQSQQATEQVQKILQEIQHATDKAVMATEEGNKEVENGLKSVESTGEVVHALGSVIQETAKASQQIVVAVREEASGIDQISTAMSEINNVTSQFVSAAEQSKSTAQELNVVTERLQSTISIYKLSEDDTNTKPDGKA